MKYLKKQLKELKVVVVREGEMGDKEENYRFD